MKPTIGRIVIYKIAAIDYDAIRKALAEEPESNFIKPVPVPAIIQHVNDDGSVRLHVFNYDGIFIANDVTQGDTPGQWNWPTREPQ